MTLLAHTPITAGFNSSGAAYLTDEEAPNVTIQHDPCCPGEVCVGVNAQGIHMDIADLYLSPTAARTMAVALLASAEHAERRDDFTHGHEDTGTDEQWRDEHARAIEWVRANPFIAISREAGSR